MTTIDLNGAWEFQPDWQSPRLRELPAGLFKEEEWLPAHVPGTVHTDLLALGKIPDPFFGDNERRVQWVAEVGWRYRRKFFVSPGFLSLAALQLVAEGLDTFAEVFINGKRLAETAKMFVPHRLAVDSWLCAGENEIEICFASPLQRTQELEIRYGKVPVALESHRVYARKAQYSFSWDWGSKLATSGLWRPIRLEGFSHVRIDSLFAVVGLDQGLRQAQVRASFEVERFSGHTTEFVVQITGPDFHELRQIAASATELAVAFSISKPQLW